MYVDEHFVELLHLIYESIQEFRWKSRCKFCILYGYKDKKDDATYVDDVNGCNCLQKEQIESVVAVFKDTWFKNSSTDFQTIVCNGRNILPGHLSSKFNTTNAISTIIRCLSKNATNIAELHCNANDLETNAQLILVLLCMYIMYILDTDNTLVLQGGSIDIDNRTEIRPCLYALTRRILQKSYNVEASKKCDLSKCDGCLQALSCTPDMGSNYDIIVHYMNDAKNRFACTGALYKLHTLCDLYEQVQKFLLAHTSATWIPILDYSFMAFISKAVFVQKDDVLHDVFVNATVVEGL